MNDSSRLLRITCLLLCVGLGSCASWRGDDAPEPQVHLVKVQVVRARLLEQKFMLHFRVDNPRTHDLTVRGLSYRVHLGDQLLAKGEHEHWFTVRPGQSGYFEVPIRTNLWPQLRGLVKMLERSGNRVPYRLEGELETGLFIADYVHLERNGVIIAADFIAE